MMQTLPELIERWNSGDGKPYKGSLIDWDAYNQDQSNIGCMCAQGQVLHLLAGWSPEKLRDTEQQEADRATAEQLGISVAHAILLRNVNDSVDGAPSIVLTNPEKVIGDQAPTILAFWRNLDRMTSEDWDAARDAAWDAAWVAAWDAARDAAWDAAWDAASYAVAEIMVAKVLRERGQPFFFLPMFGFADPEAVLAAETAFTGQPA
jgi:hypothetical protein